MYLTSVSIGYTLAAAMLALGFRYTRSPFELARITARSHAADAAYKVGPYLAPVTVVALLLLAATVAGALLIRWLS
jgi:hypothetical protein